VPGPAPTTKLLLAVLLQFWTAPVASHMLGRAAHAAGLRPAVPWAVDDLETDEERDVDRPDEARTEPGDQPADSEG
jgi:hypothetical protein